MDPITFSENSNYWCESLLGVLRHNIDGWCQQTFENKKFVDIIQQCFALLLQADFPTNNLNFHWRWWDWIQAIFLNLFYFTVLHFEQVRISWSTLSCKKSETNSKLCKMCVEKTEIRTKKTGKRLSSPAQTVCYVGNPESDDNCRQSLTFDKKKSHIKYVNYCIIGTFWAVRFWVRFQHWWDA